MSETQLKPVADIFAEPAAPALQLKAPTAPPKVEVAKATGIIELSEEIKQNLNPQLEKFMADLKTADNSPDGLLKELKNKVARMGQSEMTKLANTSNSFLQRPVKAMKDMKEGAGVANTLMDLRRVVEDLDPGRREKLWSVNKLIAWLPFAKKVDNYFKEYQASETQINAILEGLYSGKDSLQRDNASIEIEKKTMWDNMGALEQFIYVTKELASQVEAILPQIEAENAYKAKIIRDDILFYLKQRHVDLMTNMAVNMQSYMSLDVVLKNNDELIKGVERATTTTVQALRVAVMVSTALSTQSLVLDQINAVNRTTENLILNNAKMLHQQGVEIHKQASGATINPEILNEAFKQVVGALDSIEQYKAEAIKNMDVTIENLSGTISDMKTHLDKNREAEIAGLEKVLADNNTPKGVVNIDGPKLGR